jgi:hypothetical protein
MWLVTLEQLIDLIPTTRENTKSYFVFYNEWNGEITHVSRSRPVDNSQVFLETTDIVAKKILKGDINERDYIVAFVDEENLGIIKRDDKLRLRSSEKTLHQISKYYNSEWDIRAKIYTGNNKLLLEINPTSIQKLTRLTFKKELHISTESDLTIYLTKHNNPDFFIEKLDVDPVELLDKGNLLFDISNVVQYLNLNDLGLLTRRCFKNYHVEFIHDSLNILQNTLVKNRNFIIDKAYTNFPHSHLTVTKQQDNIVVTSNTTVTDLEDVGLLEDQLKLYVVGSTPDEYYGVIIIDVAELKKQGYTQLPINADLKDLNFIYNKHRLIISIEEQANA